MPLAPGAAAVSPPSTIHLRAADAAGGRAVAIFPVAGSGVDLGAVGKAIGLEPSTVRLNGYFLSRGPDLVSGVAWAALLPFFAARGLPSGRSAADPIVVQGKPAVVSDCLNLKRKLGLEEERPHKKIKVADKNSAASGAEGNRLGDDDDGLCTKRRLKMEDHNPFKKIKIAETSSEFHDSVCEESNNFSKVATNRASYSCSGARGKRSREHEMRR